MKTIDYSILVILLDLLVEALCMQQLDYLIKNVLVISGANLCMLLDLLFIDEDEFNLYEISNRIVKIGRENIVDVFEILKERMGRIRNECFMRIDDRFIHGQVGVTWISYVGAEEVVLVNDDLFNDSLASMMQKMTLPTMK